MNKIIVNIPHSSTKLSDSFMERLLISKEELQEQLNLLTDHYTDEIFKNEKCSNLICEKSRLECDTERFRDDDEEPMSKIGMGVVYTKTSDGKDLINVDNSYKLYKITSRYNWFHLALNTRTASAIYEYGKCIIIDGHSFSEKWAEMLGKDGPYPDICIGYEKDFCDYKLVEKFKNLAKKYGFNCMENYPFAGAIIPDKFYKRKDTRVNGIMIEVNKKIYMDEATLEKIEGFYKVKKLMEEFVEEISS